MQSRISRPGPAKNTRENMQVITPHQDTVQVTPPQTSPIQIHLTLLTATPSKRNCSRVEEDGVCDERVHDPPPHSSSLVLFYFLHFHTRSRWVCLGPWTIVVQPLARAILHRVQPTGRQGLASRLRSLPWRDSTWVHHATPTRPGTARDIVAHLLHAN